MRPAARSATALHSVAATIRRIASELSRIARFDDPITETAYGLDQVRRHLLAQAPDEDLDRVGVPVEILVVEVLDQLRARDDAVAVVHEILEHLVFVRGKLDRIAVDGDAAGFGVDTHRAAFELV